MTAKAHDVIVAYDALSDSEKQQVAAEILRRGSTTNGLTDEALHELADELFRGYDAEEAARAAP